MFPYMYALTQWLYMRPLIVSINHSAIGAGRWTGESKPHIVYAEWFSFH